MARGQGDNLRTGGDGASEPESWPSCSVVYGSASDAPDRRVVTYYRHANGNLITVSRYRHFAIARSSPTHSYWPCGAGLLQRLADMSEWLDRE